MATRRPYAADSVPMVNDQSETHGKRDGPKTRMERKRRDRADRAKGKKGGVHRDSRADQCLDVFLEPVHTRRLRIEHEPKIGSDGGKADRRHAEHDRLTNQPGLPGAMQRDHRQ